MRQIGLAVILALSLTLAAPVAFAQQAGKIYQIGYLSSGPSMHNLPEIFQLGLLELGWIEGPNMVTEYRFAEWRLERLPDLAAELSLPAPNILRGGIRQL